MGNSSSQVKVDPMPSFCIKGATLTKEDITVVRASWKRCMDGTEAHKLMQPKQFSTTNTTSQTVRSTDETAVTNGGDDEHKTFYSPLVFFYDTFYTQLFKVAPGVRPLFRESLKVQGRALVKMIDAAMRLVDKLDELVPPLQALAKRHTLYGARVPHYAVVGEVLLYTFKTCLGVEYTPTVELAWLTVYSVMMSVMIPVAVAEEAALARAERRKARLCGGRMAVAAVTPSAPERSAHPLAEPKTAPAPVEPAPVEPAPVESKDESVEATPSTPVAAQTA